MSDHLQDKHNIKDQYGEHIDRMTKIQDSLKEEDFQKEDGLFYCTQPNCDYSTRWMLCFHNSEGRDHKMKNPMSHTHNFSSLSEFPINDPKKGIADHAAWHRSISKAKIPYLYPDPTSSFHNPQVIARFPCPEENCRFQPPFLHYGAYAAHKTQDRFRTLIGQPISGTLKPGSASS